MNLTNRLQGLKLTGQDFFSEHREEIDQAIEEVIAKTMLESFSGDQLVYAVHQIIDSIQHQLDFKSQTACAKHNCSFCCHSEIYISETEAEYIKNNAQYTLDAAAQDRLLKQRLTESYKNLTFAEKACVFLKEGKCQVYNFRPVLCRNHAASLDTDPETCHQQNLDQTAGVVINQPRVVLMEALNMYLTMRGVTDISQIRNISEFDW